jgi:hypothetical protein
VSKTHNLLFSYAHEDENLRDQLEVHLTSLKREGLLATWHDRRIIAGQPLNNEISANLENADIILLLISPYFIASDYCFNIEMKRAMEKHTEGSAVVIPVILQPCNWHGMPFGQLMACPKDGKAISKYPNMHDAFLEVTLAVKAAASILSPDKPKLPNSSMNIGDEQQTKINHSPIRSSNLRIKKEFSDLDRNKFLVDAFSYISNYFEGSLKELKLRHADIETDFRRVDANRLTATIYVKGKEVSKCNIWISDGHSYLSGILYSIGSFRDGSYNESLNVEADGYSTYLKALGMNFHRQGAEEKMTMEGGAEYFWSMFIERLQ